MNRRRRLLLAGACVPLAAHAAVPVAVAPVTPRALRFARDHGAHPGHRLEWWYLTGQLEGLPAAGSGPLGLQLTFFRVRPPIDPANPSAFAAHQLLLAHVAIADARRGSLLVETRAAREGFGLAQAQTDDAAITVDRWSLRRDAASGAWLGQVQGAQFSLEVRAVPTQPLLLQGQDGYSRKDDGATANGAASYYYSEPQLALRASVAAIGAPPSEAAPRSGRGWLDHEWSSTLLSPRAAGWDWCGFNLRDGSALTAFRIRARPGPAQGARATAALPPFAYAALRRPGQPARYFASQDVHFEPLQVWTSPRTGARYPVAMAIVIGSRRFESHPLMPDQELDVRGTGAPAYWEGASRLLEDGQEAGSGYLELTGYAGAVPGASG